MKISKQCSSVVTTLPPGFSFDNPLKLKKSKKSVNKSTYKDNEVERCSESFDSGLLLYLIEQGYEGMELYNEFVRFQNNFDEIVEKLEEMALNCKPVKREELY